MLFYSFTEKLIYLCIVFMLFSNPTEAFIMNILKMNSYWIRRENVAKIYKKLAPETDMSHIFYYRDIFVWLPDIQHKCRLYCPSCNSDKRIGVHGLRGDTYGRRVCDLNTHYFILSRRYICHACEENAKEQKRKAAAVLSSGGNKVSVIADNTTADSYTFNGHDSAVLEKLPIRFTKDFPAVLTYRGGLDKKITDMQRILFNSGVRPQTFSRMLLELHSANYTREHIAYEQDLRDNKLNSKREMFSTFKDKTKYNGLVPTGRYLSSVYMAQTESLKTYYANEVMTRTEFTTAVIYIYTFSSAPYVFLSIFLTSLIACYIGKESWRYHVFLGCLIQNHEINQ